MKGRNENNSLNFPRKNQKKCHNNHACSALLLLLWMGLGGWGMLRILDTGQEGNVPLRKCLSEAFSLAGSKVSLIINVWQATHENDLCSFALHDDVEVLYHAMYLLPSPRVIHKYVLTYVGSSWNFCSSPERNSRDRRNGDQSEAKSCVQYSRGRMGSRSKKTFGRSLAAWADIGSRVSSLVLSLSPLFSLCFALP